MGLKHGSRKARSQSPKRVRRRDLKKPTGQGYDPRVLLIQCPVCERGVGQHCVSTGSNGSWSDYSYSAPGRELENPHPDRVALARGPR